MKYVFISLAVLALAGIGTGAWILSTNAPEIRADIPAESSPAPTEATLEVYSPEVYIIPNGATEQTEAATGQKIGTGTRVITGERGRAQLLYPNKSVTRLDHNTQITLSALGHAPDQIVVKLDKNRIWSRVVKLLGKDTYETRTTVLVAAVRGTSYGHGILADGANKITTTKGTIDSACANGSKDVLVPRDYKIALKCQTDEPTESLPIDESDRDEWFEFNASEDRKLEDRFGLELYNDATPSGVLGEKTDTLSASPSASPSPGVIDCKGIDGKISRVTKEVCDSVNNFWKTKLFIPSPSPTIRINVPTVTPFIPTLTPTPVPGISPFSPLLRAFYPDIFLPTATPTQASRLY